MKIYRVALVVSIMLTCFNNPEINEVRTNYRIAVPNKKLCEKMIGVLEQSKEKLAVHLASLGGYQRIWANHVFNPMSKLTIFKKGKKNIELAISKEPENVEIRYIRFRFKKKHLLF